MAAADATTGARDADGVSVETFVRAIKARRGRLPHDIATFIALTCCEAILASPRLLTTRDVRIAPDGSLVLATDAPPAESRASAHAIVHLLAALLVVSGPGVPPSLLALIERSDAEGWELGRLRDALEVLLVPLNRGASRRVLARCLRDAQRETSAAPVFSPEAAELDADMDDFLASDLMSQDEDDPLGGPTPVDLDAVHENTDDPHDRDV